MNDDFIKKELPFLSQVDDKMYYIEINLATQIYKYFHIFRNNAMNNISLKNKEKEKERRLTHDKSENIIRFQNLKTNRDSKGNIITIECNNEKNLVKKNKQIFSGSKSTKKMAVFQKLNNNIFKKQTLNDKIINKNIIEKMKTISKNEKKENITYANKNNNKRYSNNKENENILNNSEQINLNNLKKNLKPKKERDEFYLYIMNSYNDISLFKDDALSIIKKWEHWDISTMSFLSIINNFAGRSFKDLTQYPVFPWVIKDYESNKLNSFNETNIRELNKPIGDLGNENRLECFLQTYKESKELEIEAQNKKEKKKNKKKKEEKNTDKEKMMNSLEKEDIMEIYCSMAQEGLGPVKWWE